MSHIRTNLTEIQQRIADAAAKSGRSPEEITLVAVSKVHPASAIREAYAAGQRHFGENYAQELEEKNSALGDLTGMVWHFIGHLQRNKTRIAASCGAVVETIDSTRLVHELDRQAKRLNRNLFVLVQVNVGEEAQKSGATPEELPVLLDAVEGAENLNLTGLMTIPPWDLDAEETRKHFVRLRKLRDQHGGTNRLPCLSMGMSHDFEVAIEEGATHVRVGTAIFGARPARR